MSAINRQPYYDLLLTVDGKGSVAKRVALDWLLDMIDAKNEVLDSVDVIMPRVVHAIPEYGYEAKLVKDALST